MEEYRFSLDEQEEERSRQLLKNSIIVDLLLHGLLDQPYRGSHGEDLIDSLRAGGVTAVNLTLPSSLGLHGVLSSFYNHFMALRAAGHRLTHVLDVDDVYHAKSSSKLGIIFGFQGAGPIQEDLRMLLIFRKLGLRILQLTYNENNRLGSGCYEPKDGGLTRFGQQVVSLANRLGVVVDLSHAGERTSLDAMEYTQAPPIFSHSSVKALCAHPRNISDTQIRALASRGGVVGLCPHSMLCEREPGSWPTLDTFLDHIDYVCDMVGPDHVGIGTDRFVQPGFSYDVTRIQFQQFEPSWFGSYKGDTMHVRGFSRCDEWLNLVRGLVSRGYKDEDIQKIIGGNAIRVLRSAWSCDELGM